MIVDVNFRVLVMNYNCYNNIENKNIFEKKNNVLFIINKRMPFYLFIFIFL